MRHLELDLDDVDLVDLTHILRKAEADAKSAIGTAAIYLGMPEILGSTPEFKEAGPARAQAMSCLALITNIADAAGIDLSLPDHDSDTREDEPEDTSTQNKFDDWENRLCEENFAREQAEDTDEPANAYYDAPGYGEPTPTLD